MAVSATFIADFTSFNDAVQKAELTLKSFQSGAAQVEKQLNRVGDSFSGRKVLQEATLAAKAIEDIGGASKLTAAEQSRVNATITEALEKYKALGMQAPQELIALQNATKAETTLLGELQGAIGPVGTALGIAFSVGSLVTGVKHLIDFGDELDNTSQKTGISVEALQALDRMSKQANTSLDAITSTINIMQARLGSGEANAAVRALGLDIDTLIAARPDEAFGMVAEALSGVSSQADKAHLAQQVLGRGWQEVGGLLVNGYREWQRESENTVGVIDQHQAAMLAHANDFKDKFTSSLKGLGAELIVGIGQTVGILQEMFTKGLDGAGLIKHDIMDIATAGMVAADQLGAANDKTIDHNAMVAASLQALRDDYYKPLTDALKDQIIQLQDYGASNTDITQLLGVTEGQIRRVNDEVRAGQAELKAWNEQQAKLAADGAAIWKQMMADNAALTKAAVAESEKRVNALSGEILKMYELKAAAESSLAATLQAASGSASAGGSFTGQQDAINADFDQRERDFKRILGSNAGESVKSDAQSAINALEAERAFKLSQLAIDAQKGGGASSAAGSIGGGSVGSGGGGSLGPSPGGIFAPNTSPLIRPDLIPVSGAGGFLGYQIQVNASGSFFDTPESINRLADRVGAAVTSRIAGRGGVF